MRMDHFERCGCNASDHGLERIVCEKATEAELNEIVTSLIAGKDLTLKQRDAFQFDMMRFFGEEYGRRDWVMEIHYGALRNLNSKGYRLLGPDTGYDAIASGIRVDGLPVLLDGLAAMDALPKTILFSLDPADNAMLNTVSGCFQKEGVQGQVQQGAAWWFNDTLEGMRSQMTTYAGTSLLGNSLGMVTDSRSLLSYTRHEYFRRILCDLLGGWVDAGEYPGDMERLGQLVSDIGFNNAKKYFGF